MEEYLSFLQETMLVILKTNAVIFAVLLLLLISAVALRNKVNTSKLRNVSLTLLTVVVIECGILVIPRLIDLHQKSLIVVHDAQLVIGSTNSTYEDGSVMFYGIGYVQDQTGNSIMVLGLNFFDLSTVSDDDLKSGTAVYGKYSRQLLGYQKNS